MSAEQTVFLVDDQPEALQALALLLRIAGLETQCFDSTHAFFEGCPSDVRGCLVLDMTMPGMDGAALQRELLARDYALPVIFLTGHADLDQVVAAVKAGAIDILSKPVDAQRLIDAVTRALDCERECHADFVHHENFLRKLNTLTAREREVLDLVIEGKLNKQVAWLLGSAEKTVKVHRGRIMRKLAVQTLAELVQRCAAAKIVGAFEVVQLGSSRSSQSKASHLSHQSER